MYKSEDPNYKLRAANSWLLGSVGIYHLLAPNKIDTEHSDCFSSFQLIGNGVAISISISAFLPVMTDVSPLIHKYLDKSAFWLYEKTNVVLIPTLVKAGKGTFSLASDYLVYTVKGSLAPVDVVVYSQDGILTTTIPSIESAFDIYESILPSSQGALSGAFFGHWKYEYTDGAILPIISNLAIISLVSGSKWAISVLNFVSVLSGNTAISETHSNLALGYFIGSTAAIGYF
jgi:hypothetical protein